MSLHLLSLHPVIYVTVVPLKTTSAMEATMLTSSASLLELAELAAPLVWDSSLKKCLMMLLSRC